MAGVIAGAAIGFLAVKLSQRSRPASNVKASKNENLEDRSTTSSAGGGAAAYETKRAVDEYLQFHFGAPKEMMPYAFGPHKALDFTVRLALLCERFCDGLGQFDEDHAIETRALDVGCAVGGATFELARSFQRAVGVDYSNHFVNAANLMKAEGRATYSSLEEGEIRVNRVARVADDIERDRAMFLQGDACHLDESLGVFDAVLAANLLCRLPDPWKFLDRLPTLVKPGGVAVLVSPYSWLEAWTPKDKWVGGFNDASGAAVRSRDRVGQRMEANGFELVHEEDVPFLIREHARKFQYGVSNATVWKRKASQA